MAWWQPTAENGVEPFDAGAHALRRAHRGAGGGLDTHREGDTPEWFNWRAPECGPDGRGRDMSERMLHARDRLLAGPDYALIHARHWPQALVHELLNPLALIRLRRVDVASGIRGDAVDGEELARLPAAIAEHRQDFQRLPVHDVHPLVPAVGEEDVLLLGIARERD